jgi:hypothetical protein
LRRLSPGWIDRQERRRTPLGGGWMREPPPAGRTPRLEAVAACSAHRAMGRLDAAAAMEGSAEIPSRHRRISLPLPTQRRRWRSSEGRRWDGGGGAATSAPATRRSTSAPRLSSILLPHVSSLFSFSSHFNSFFACP